MTLAGTPLRAVRAHVDVEMSGASEEDAAAIFDAAREASTIANSIAPAVPVAFDRHMTGDA